MKFLPCLVEVNDYHEFDYIQQVYQIINTKIKVKEVDWRAYGNKPYLGVIYESKKPPNKEIKELWDKGIVANLS